MNQQNEPPKASVPAVPATNYDSEQKRPELASTTGSFPQRRKSFYLDHCTQLSALDESMHPRFSNPPRKRDLQLESVEAKNQPSILPKEIETVEAKKQPSIVPKEIESVKVKKQSSIVPKETEFVESEEQPPKIPKDYKIPKISKDSKDIQLKSKPSPESSTLPSSGLVTNQDIHATNEVATILSSSSEKKPEELIKNLKEILGTDNFKKIKTLLVEGVSNNTKEIKTESKPKSKSGVQDKGKSVKSSPKTAPKGKTPNAEEVILEDKVETALDIIPKKRKRRAFRKLTELDRLHVSINEMYDRDGVVRASGPRACTQAGKQKYSEIEGKLLEKFNVKPSYVLVHRLNDKQAAEQVKKRDSVETEPEKVSNKEEPIKERPSKTAIKHPTNTVTSPRKRSNWSRGVILKKAKKIKLSTVEHNSDEEWDDLEEPKGNIPENKTMKLSKLIYFMNSSKSSIKVKKYARTPAMDISSSEKEVGHLSTTSTETSFKCEICQFESARESSFLEVEHIKANHKTKSWTKVCQNCANVPDQIEPTFDGVFHDFQTHIPDEVNKLGPQSAEIKPSLKIRLLPGDKLSTVPPAVKPLIVPPAEKQSLALPPPIKQFHAVPAMKQYTRKPEAIVKPTRSIVPCTLPATTDGTWLFGDDFCSKSTSNLLISCPEEERASNETDEMVVKIEDSPKHQDLTFSLLRPWINVAQLKGKSKTKSASEEMLGNETCLAALYKCMGFDCAFFSSDCALFTKHLELHQFYQSDDSRNFLSCAYCLFGSTSIVALTDHIKAVHGYDKFSCAFCFYRAFSDFYIFDKHKLTNHPGTEKRVIICEPTLKRNMREELAKIRKQIAEKVPSLKCLSK